MKALERWNLHLRWQHILLFLSMGILIGTGMPLRYSYMPWAVTMTGWVGGPLNLVSIHKGAAIALALVGVYHLFYMLGRLSTGRATWAMLPSWKDVTDAYHHARYLLGFSREQPDYDRYTYLEKFEYLAVFWGMVVMGLSGFALWFPLRAASMLPGWGLQVARIIHSNEALVAVIAIGVGHFFYVILHPHTFPFSKVWLTGLIERDRLAEEHPREYQRLIEQGKLAPESEDHVHQPLTPARRILAVVELALYVAVFFIILKSFIPLLFA